MPEPYLGEIRMFSFNYAPNGWMSCNGQILSIFQNQALYAVIGPTYGGNGVTTFALPNLNGRTPVGVSVQTPLGQSGGEAEHNLTIGELPRHSHLARAANTTATEVSPQNNVWGSQDNVYSANAHAVMSQEEVGQTGGSQPHLNLQPYSVTNFCIAVNGLFPPRN